MGCSTLGGGLGSGFIAALVIATAILAGSNATTEPLRRMTLKSARNALAGALEAVSRFAQLTFLSGQGALVSDDLCACP